MAGLASERALLDWPRVALRCGRVKEVLRAAEAGVAALPRSAPLWRQFVALQTQACATKASFVLMIDNARQRLKSHMYRGGGRHISALATADCMLMKCGCDGLLVSQNPWYNLSHSTAQICPACEVAK